MMHKTWCSTEKVPYCFSKSSIEFEGHVDQKIDDLNPILSKITGLVAAINSLRFALLFFNSLTLGYSVVILMWNFQTHLVTDTFKFTLKLPSGEDHKTSNVLSQQWLQYWIGAVRQQAITWTNVNQGLQCNKELPGVNEPFN